MIRIWLVLMLLASPAAAQAVRATAGEHEGFTRLVLQFPQAVDWQVGRSDDGYELRIDGPAPRYDLSRAFALIGRDRLAALWADPESGALRLGIGCACHALPFALRPDTVVIDLRDGPPPEGWGFETGFDGKRRPALVAKRVESGKANFPAERPAASAVPPASGPVPDWNWTEQVLSGKAGASTVAPAMPVPDARLDALRQTLAESFSRAATQDLVDPVEKLPARSESGTGTESESAAATPPMAEVHLGANVDVRTALAPQPDLASDGALCPGDDALAVQDWGDERPIHEQMADGTASLAGEFDRTQPDALYRAIRFQLFLGFGAEARGLMRAFDGPLPEGPLWTSLSYLVDGDADPAGAFSGLAGCDDAAALWSVVADPALPVSDANTKALLRSFSALPPHLRLGIGPPLAERFMAAGDRVTAQALSDALLRPHETDDARRTALMQARFALDAGDYAKADAALAPLLADPGPLVAEILPTQVDLAVKTLAPVPQSTVTSIEALLPEAGEGNAAALQRALVLGHALAGSFDTAFALLPESPESAPDLWHIMAEAAPDEALLSHALTAEDGPRAAAGADTRRKLAERLLQLGFAEAAQFWAGADDPLLAARAALLMGQPDRVLQLLGPADGDEARKLKAEALLQVDAKAAVPAFDDLGDAEASARAARLAEAWPELAAKGAEPWRKVAGALQPPVTPEQTLARGRALAENAGQTRAAIADLLATVPPPEAH